MKDGKYLFREQPTNWWRAVEVSNGNATADWIAGKIAADNLKGEFHGPLDASNPEWREANSTPGGRLLRRGWEPAKE
jgi:hypothetical protein